MDVCGKALPKVERLTRENGFFRQAGVYKMDIKKEEIIKYGVAILAVLNLIWLFGFEYRIPGKAADRPAAEEAAGAATTADTIEVAATAVTIAIAEEEEPQEETQEESETEENTVRCRVTVSNSLNIRGGPGTNYAVVTTANYNEILTVLSNENGWVHVRNAGGQEGYVSESFVEIIENQSE